MQEFLPFIVIGLTAGSVYGLAGTGLVLTYKTSGVFNFAYGAIAAVAAYVFYWLHVQQGMAWQPAALLCLFVLGPPWVWCWNCSPGCSRVWACSTRSWG